MNYIQYEELCRLFVSKVEKIAIEKIRSGKIPSATRPDSEVIENQIDLYWELENKLTLNLVIVNAKWRSSIKDKVDQNDVFLIQQVKHEIDANKAMIITNTDFTDGARKAADNHRIALHIVRPNFDYAILDPKNRKKMQTQLHDFYITKPDSKPVYMHVEVCKGIDLGMDATGQSTGSSRTDGYSNKIAKTSMNKIAPQGSNRRASSNLQKVQSGSGTGRQGTSQTGRQGGPPSGRQGGSVTKGSGTTRGGGGTSKRSK